MDDAGNVIARARVSPDLPDEGRAALARLVEVAQRWQADRDAADPVGAAERARRYEAGQERIRSRMRRYRGEAG
jgi:hypothetical protein